MIATIKRLVEAETAIDDISVKSRRAEIVEARVIFSILCLRHTTLSLQRIAKEMNRHHSTVVHHRKVYNDWTSQPSFYTSELQALSNVDHIIHTRKEKTEKEIDVLIMMRKMNKLQEDELKHLRRVTAELRTEVKRLKKYEPIW